ncbi:alpha/beta fold hydrolase [Sedimentitalea nanhaiensis]|uniref:Pimeloyl-ACP methyl ester carboxylesterase n=1 Tax=Sedimentitalea nanhaiensis TaxID=999627 RepID=A0A1I7CGF0_9RHOB|nr:alpha/beta fold hydrolase [Sedimentitalea nanhaiensis]SFT98497.1 Pimeloyl-ACP methyl ester carboxylesterase [Sedimentitalea nanhaiensis]
MSPILWLIVILVLALLALAVLRTRSMARQAERLVPQVGQIQTVRGGSVHYIETGARDAPPVVLIHGLSGQLQHFTYAIADLLADEFRVIAVDRPGCGYSRRDSDDLATPTEQARMIGEALDALGIERPVLVGHSLGGAVALTMALERPEKTGALALLCPATQDQTEVPEVFRGLQIKSPWLRRLIGNTIAVPLAAATKDKVLAIVFAPEPCPEDFMIRGGAVLGMRPQAFVAASADVVGMQSDAARVSARYAAELTVPGGILYGAADAILSPAAHGHTMQAHGLDYETLEARGHMIPITAPADCADFIRRMAARAR